MSTTEKDLWFNINTEVAISFGYDQYILQFPRIYTQHPIFILIDFFLWKDINDWNGTFV